jgi:threonine/homoserine/homoserine lactone efflux protein
MNLALLAAFWGVVVLLIIVPGPDWAYTLASALRDRSVLPAVAGIVLGYLLLTAIVAAGVGALVSRYPLVLTIVTLVGAAYLIYLGASLVLRPGGIHEVDAAAHPARSAAWPRILRGVGVSGLNPKGLLIFVALLPQFTDADAAWPFALQVIVLGLVFAATCAIFYLALGLGARAILRTRPAVSRVVSRVSGGAMIVVGVLLLVERLVT